MLLIDVIGIVKNNCKEIFTFIDPYPFHDEYSQFMITKNDAEWHYNYSEKRAEELKEGGFYLSGDISKNIR